MNVQVVNPDQIVSIDGEGLVFNLGLDASIWAIQWGGEKGHIEYSDDTPNLEITDFSDYQFLIDGHAAEKARIAQAEVDRIAAFTYVEHRDMEYPDLKSQLDMQYWDGVHGTTTWADAIKAVKDKYPKG